MCIRDRNKIDHAPRGIAHEFDAVLADRLRHLLDVLAQVVDCLLYTSDAADDLLCVDLGGRRIIKKKKTSRAARPGSVT